jgi:hypothetical protein
VLPISIVKSSDLFSIVLPFLAIIKLVCLQSPPSATLATIPFDGDAGKVNVNVPPVVSAII